MRSITLSNGVTIRCDRSGASASCPAGHQIGAYYCPGRHTSAALDTAEARLFRVDEYGTQIVAFTKTGCGAGSPRLQPLEAEPQSGRSPDCDTPTCDA